jgi:hypothetical protein
VKYTIKNNCRRCKAHKEGGGCLLNVGHQFIVDAYGGTQAPCHPCLKPKTERELALAQEGIQPHTYMNGVISRLESERKNWKRFADEDHFMGEVAEKILESLDYILNGKQKD